MKSACPFCSPANDEIVLRNVHCYVRWDRYPVSKGHLLIIPIRHVADFFALADQEHSAVLEMLWQAKLKLESEFHPDGYNVGVNIGQTAGQTVMHVHIHLIPRYVGDMERPEGGVRGVIPEKRLYRKL